MSEEPRKPIGRRISPKVNIDKNQMIDAIKSVERSRAGVNVRRPNGQSPKRRNTRFSFSEFLKRNAKRIIYWSFILIVSIAISTAIIKFGNEIFAFVRPAVNADVAITQGSSTGEIATALKAAGIIDTVELFKLYSKLKKADGKYQYGSYNLNAQMSYDEIIAALKKASVLRESVKFTVPEGYEVNQIVELLVKQGICNKEKLIDVLQNYNFEYDFLQGLPKRRDRLEGYLFPDTYEIFKGEDEISVVNRMLENFNIKVTKEMRDKCKVLNMSLDQVINLASVIEREGKAKTDLPIVSSVFHNRLKNNSEYPYLQSCATVQYIMTERRDVLTFADTEIDNPYNTYKNRGLPPGPIANPGIAAIEAALNPAPSDYFFFVAKGDGFSIFSKTYAEHLKAIKIAGTTWGTGAINK